MCVDLYRTATGEYAHYLLPATDMFERADVNITGLGLQFRPWVQFTDRVVEPRAERREEWWIFARLAQALGLRSPLDAPGANPWARIDHMLGSRGLSLAELRERPHGVVFEDGLEPGSFYEAHIQTPDRRVDCCPEAFAPALAEAERIYQELAAEDPARLKLITRRNPWMHNSWYANIPHLRRGVHATNPLFVHPDDLAARKLHPGGRARLWNEHGAIEVQVEADPGLVRGVVALAHGGGHAGASGLRVASAAPGVNPNALLPIGPGSFERLSNQAFMTGVPVELEALPGEGPPPS